MRPQERCEGAKRVMWTPGKMQRSATLALWVIPAHGTVGHRGAGGETPQNLISKSGKKPPHGRGGHLPPDRAGQRLCGCQGGGRWGPGGTWGSPGPTYVLHSRKAPRQGKTVGACCDCPHRRGLPRPRTPTSTQKEDPKTPKEMM